MYIYIYIHTYVCISCVYIYIYIYIYMCIEREMCLFVRRCRCLLRVPRWSGSLVLVLLRWSSGGRGSASHPAEDSQLCSAAARQILRWPCLSRRYARQPLLHRRRLLHSQTDTHTIPLRTPDSHSNRLDIWEFDLSRLLFLRGQNV